MLKWSEQLESQPDTSAMFIAVEEEEEYSEQSLPGHEDGSKLDLSQLSEDHQRELCSILSEGRNLDRLGWWNTGFF